MGRYFLRLALVCIGAAALAGCGGSSGPPKPTDTLTVDAAFYDRAEGVCAPYAEDNEAKPFPYPTFDPQQPDPALLPKVAAYLDSLAVHHTGLAALKGLGQPAQNVKQWQGVLTLVNQLDAVTAAQIAAARDNDPPEFTSTHDQDAVVRPRLDEALVAAGFAATSTCYLAFG